MEETSETEKSINFLVKLLDKDTDTIRKCIHETSEKLDESFSSVLNIITYYWIDRLTRFLPSCKMCGLPKEKYTFPCRLRGSPFLDYKELKEWCDLKEGQRKIASSRIPRRERLEQARREFEKEKKELKEKRRKSPRVRFI